MQPGPEMQPPVPSGSANMTSQGVTAALVNEVLAVAGVEGFVANIVRNALLGRPWTAEERYRAREALYRIHTGLTQWVQQGGHP